MTKELENLIKQTIKHIPDEEKALGWLRYEALRKCDIRQFADLTTESLKGEEKFDYLVDELIFKFNVKV